MKREIEEYPNWSFWGPDVDGFLDFEYKVKIDGFTICLKIQYCEHYLKMPLYSVSACVYKKRKIANMSYWDKDLITGSGNIKYLAAIKAAIEQFEEVYFYTNSNFFRSIEEKIIVAISAIDKRRMSVYEKGLKKIGYTKHKFSGSEFLVKVLKYNPDLFL